MLWDQRFDASLALRLLVHYRISARNPRGKVILAIARNRYKDRARHKGVAPSPAARFAIDSVMKVIGRMEQRAPQAAESRFSSKTGTGGTGGTGCEAKAA